MKYINSIVLHKFFLSAIISIFTIATSSIAADLHFSWLPSSEGDLNGYAIHYGPISKDYTESLDMGTPSLANGRVDATISVPDLTEGETYYFALTAYNSAGDHSDFTNEISWTVPVTDNGSPGAEVIIDNGDPGTQAIGNWKPSAGTDYYGTKSDYSFEANATYSYETPLYGRQELSLCWTHRDSRCEVVPVQVYDGDTLIDTLEINQLTNDGTWNTLGSYNFSSGTAKVVVIASDSSCSTNADAVRFVGTQIELDHITVEGPSSVIGGSTENYAATSHFDDGSSGAINPEWNIDCPNTAQISDTGALVTTTVAQDEICTLTATYEENGIIATADMDVTVQYVAPPINEITIDNDSPGTTSSGTWKPSNGVDYYGIKSVFTYNANASYTFEASLSGAHEVSVSWTYRESRCTDVPIKIYDGTTLLDTIRVNQQQNGGTWAILGTYEFFNTGSVVIESGGSSCSTNADAAQFKPVPDYVPPAPSEIVIDNKSAETLATGTWKTSAGLNSYGTKSEYSSERNATYTFETDVHGAHQVSLWWTFRDSRCTSVPVHIYDDMKRIDTVIVNQQQNDGKWNVLGSYDFSSGIGAVVIASGTSCSTSADAVRFYRTN